MAKLLISFPAHIYDEGKYRLVTFYDGFLSSLKKCGNELFVINSAEYLHQFWDGCNHIQKGISEKKLLKDVLEFNPELIISFNHSIPKVILENTDCKIAVWDADSIDFYNDKEYIKKNISRYTFLAFSEAGVTNALNFGASASKVHFVNAATEIRAEEIMVDKNISFIGSNFATSYNFILQLHDKTPAKLKPLIEELSHNFYSNHLDIIHKHQLDGIENHISPKMLASLSAVQNRTSILNLVEPLGLSLYGSTDWYNIGQYLPWLAMSYVPEKIYSLKHNQEIYNSSKIGLNISHSQATTGFPWRILDIMASNACLVSDYKPGLVEFTKGYVNIPYYENQVDAYNICKKMLNDESWRKDIVQGAQFCINDKGRWEHRFKELSSIFELNFLPTTKVEKYEFDSQDLVKEVDDYYYWYIKLRKRITSTLIHHMPKTILRLCLKTLVFFKIKISSKFIVEAVDIKKRSMKLKS